MKRFEISSKENKNGRRKFKLILYKIFPDSCVDEVNQVGTDYNLNGITWIKEYCQNAIDSIKGMSLRCEFLDEERTQISGHGETGIKDDMPVFEDATVIGTFTNGYIDEVETDEGLITACIGEGEIDAQCYHNFVKKLDEDIAKGIYPSGSIEIMKTPDNDEIIYKYGYKEKGRIPMEFIHSGYALLGVTPADSAAKLIELNDKHKEESQTMNEQDIKNIVAQVINELNSKTAEINQIKAECEAKIAEANSAHETVVSEKNELQASYDQLKTAYDAANAEIDDLHTQLNAAWEARDALKKALGEAKAKELLGELNSALATFTDEEKEYAKAEIEAFNANPVESEINSVVNKVWEGIGKTAKAAAEKVQAEQNQAKIDTVEDIFSPIEDVDENNGEVSIF